MYAFSGTPHSPTDTLQAFGFLTEWTSRPKLLHKVNGDKFDKISPYEWEHQRRESSQSGTNTTIEWIWYAKRANNSPPLDATTAS